MTESFLNGKVLLWQGDCRDVLAQLEEHSVDSCVTDPPYHLASIVKRFGADNAAPAKSNGASGVYKRASSGFMGQRWDGGDIAFEPATWAAVYRVLKPGAHLVAFGSTRGYHRMACAIEDAGFEVRDSLMFLFATGFPKSLSINNALEKHDAVCRCSTYSDPVPGLRDGEENTSCVEEAEQERILQPVVPSKACYSADTRDAFPQRQEGVDRGELYQLPPKDDGRKKSGMERRGNVSQEARKLCVGEVRPMSASLALNGENGRVCDGASAGDGRMDRAPVDADGMRPPSRPRTAEQPTRQSGTLAGQPQSQASRAWEICARCGKPMVPEGLGTALKPAFEPIVLARKPLSEKTVAANVLRWRTGALNIDGCRVGTEIVEAGNGSLGKNSIYGKMERNASTASTSIGRWPANVVTDGSAEVVAMFPETGAAKASERGLQHSGRHGGLADIGGNLKDGTNTIRGHNDTGGSAARFFFSAKADSDDRIGSKHPTVKPVDLMQWLVRLVTPPGGVVLDCFAGTGTTGEAAWREGMSAVLIEREDQYCADIRRRMEMALAGPEERSSAIVKAKGLVEDAGPLFANVGPT